MMRAGLPGSGRRPSGAAWLVAALLVLLLFGAVRPQGAAAHSFAVTRVELDLEGTEVRLTFWLNPPDLLQNVLSDTLDRRAFEDLPHLHREARRIGDYVERHTAVWIDGTALPARDRGGWPPELLPPPPAPPERDADGRIVPASLPLTLRYRFPDGARRLDLELRHYASGGFTALFDVTARRSGSPYSRTDYIPAGRRLAYDLDDAGLGRPAGLEKPERGGAPAETARDLPPAPPAEAEPRPLEAPPQPLGILLRQFLELGFTHILPHGLDHILFVLGLLLLAPRLKPVVTQVTAFTLAHSLTLALAMLGVVRLPSRLVEPLIALSIAVVALENVFRREVHPARWLLVFGFGLVHGLGFAGVLTGLGVPPGRLLPALVSFNVGVELGQLAVLALAGVLVVPIAGRRWYHARVAVPASLAIAAVGLLWAVQRALGGG